MKKYKYVGTEAQLVEHGFKVFNAYAERDVIFIPTKSLSEAWYYQKNAISFDNGDRDDDTDITPYIQDLIDDGLVEVVG